jgi:undecaprenyl pyrophosphate phosphatase UppP
LKIIGAENVSTLSEKVTENAAPILILAVTLIFFQNMWLALDNNMIFLDWDEEERGQPAPDPYISSLLTDICTALALWLAGLCFAGMAFDEKFDVWLRIASVAAVVVLIVGSPIIG